MLLRGLGWPIALIIIVSSAHNCAAGPAAGESLRGLAENNVCPGELTPLREDLEKNSKLIDTARERGAPLADVCRLFGKFAESEIKLIGYLKANAERCGVLPGIFADLKARHRNTEARRQKVCMAAHQAPRREPVGPIGDFDHLDVFRRGKLDGTDPRRVR